ncbi:MAG: glutamate--tRNA ligase [Bdellovibrionales bacterium GWB1_55_8]|nr:MAG: glutamate--tRNA ligase [Bdellovibrionales bacterium GWB1_55_8]
MTAPTTRTRFAPSPTGYMHIGNLRTALYAFLQARHDGGQFLLRIEDTDQARLVSDAVEVIYESLRATNLLWDEGPDKGGSVGPYIQSERKPIYKEYADKLIATGHAYRCFCTKEALDEIRKHALEEEEAPIAAYDGRCSRLSESQVQENLKANLPFVIRQKIPREGATTFQDLVYGEITISNDQLDDQVLIKADGLPTYNFANVVDDHLMRITHVMRGSEYISSAPKYMQLYRAFGWEAPLTVHLPHILGADGKKLSKRTGSAALSDLLDKGYLPEGILNYIALLGWSPGDNTEFFTLQNLIERFDLKRVNKAPAIFDEKKLAFINSLHIKALPPERFHELALRYYPAPIAAKFDLRKLSALSQTRVEKLTDLGSMWDFLLKFPFPFDRALFEHKKMKTTPETSLPVLKEFLPQLETQQAWDNAALYDFMVRFAAEKSLKNSQVMWPVRVALTGLPSTPGGATEVAELLGREESLSRIRQSIQMLGG